MSSESDSIRRELSKLEATARLLDPGPAQRTAWLNGLRAFTEAFLEGLNDTPGFKGDDGLDGFSGTHFEETPADIEALLPLFEREVLEKGANTASGRYVAYIPGSGVYPSALGDFLADVCNRYAGVSLAGPGATRMEQSLIRWMCRLVGYPESANGDLASGGSIATLSAMVAARDAKDVTPGRIGNACVYLTRQAHHCVRKALHIAGLSEAKARYLPMDERYRMDPAALERAMAEDREKGLQPFLVIASAGSTDTGTIDPIDDIARIAQQYEAWLHVDAAYGGFFLLCEETRPALAAMRRADSIVLDPHKGLFLPFGSGAVLLRDGTDLLRSFSYTADYLQDASAHIGHGAQYSPADYSPELSRPFRGLRMWLPLKLFGLAPFRAALQEKLLLARYFRQEIARLDRWEVGPEPDLSVVTYRYIPRRGDADDFNRRLNQALLDDGRIFISSTQIDGVFTLRLAVLNFRTHRDIIDELLELLPRMAEKLERENEKTP